MTTIELFYEKNAIPTAENRPAQAGGGAGLCSAAQAPVGFALRAKGHAGQNRRGSDIVCAAVSALVQSLACALHRWDQGLLESCALTGEAGSACMELHARVAGPEGAERLAGALAVAETGFALLQRAYPQFVCFICGEVQRDAKSAVAAADDVREVGDLALQYFAEGGAAAPASGSAQTGPEGGSLPAEAENAAKQNPPTGEAMSRGAAKQAKAANPRKKAENPLASVQYGKQEEQDAAAPQADTAQQSPPSERDKNAEFEKLIRGEYKEQFTRRTQSIIDKRFKQQSEQQAQAGREKALLAQLAARYGVAANDMDALEKAVKGDESYWEKEAQSRGLSTGDVRRIKQLESENARLVSEATQGRAQAAANRIATGWLNEAKELTQVYPGFDMSREVQNPDFLRLLKAGTPVRRAYESIHLDELLGGAMKVTADRVAEGIEARVSERGRRPAENGVTPRAGAVVKTDVSSLSRADREEIERRVLRGEKIRF